MTPNQIRQFNRMRAALLSIARDYESPENIRKKAWDLWGCEPVEALEMAYENLQALAESAVKGVRAIKKGDP